MENLKMELKEIVDSLSESNRSDSEVDVAREAESWLQWLDNPAITSEQREGGLFALDKFIFNPWG